MRPRAPIRLLGLALLAFLFEAPHALATRTPHGKDAVKRGVYFQNNHHLAMHISIDWAAKDLDMYPDLKFTNEYVEPGKHVYMSAPKDTSPKYYIGPTANDRSAYVNGRRDHNSVVEATYDSNGVTYFDMDIEKGFSVPLWCHGVKDDWDSGEGCLNDLLAHCPEQDKHVDPKTGIYDYCVGTDSPENIHLRTEMCPKVYTLWDSDKTTTIKKGHVLRCDIMDPKKLHALPPKNNGFSAIFPETEDF